MVIGAAVVVAAAIIYTTVLSLRASRNRHASAAK
jgi:hypothetical protein